jgi:hypothetical protein
MDESKFTIGIPSLGGRWGVPNYHLRSAGADQQGGTFGPIGQCKLTICGRMLDRIIPQEIESPGYIPAVAVSHRRRIPIRLVEKLKKCSVLLIMCISVWALMSSNFRAAPIMTARRVSH